ncbi:hypothetical protein MRX96_054694 [Rhipicephalus microplus]
MRAAPGEKRYPSKIEREHVGMCSYGDDKVHASRVVPPCGARAPSSAIVRREDAAGCVCVVLGRSSAQFTGPAKLPYFASSSRQAVLVALQRSFPALRNIPISTNRRPVKV